MLANSGLGTMLGRADLSSFGVAPVSVQADRYAFTTTSVQQSSPLQQVANAGPGRLAAGTLIVGVVGLGAFYLWTRSHQNADHFHSGVDSVLLYGVSAIIVINLVRIGAGKLAAQPGVVGQIGSAIGGLVHFSD